MFAVTGKIWSIDKVDFDNRKYLRMVLKKKRHDKEISLCFLVFKEAIIEQCNQGLFVGGDYVETKFYIKANEYKDRYYNNLFVDKITLLKRSKSHSTLNMFSKLDTDLSEFE
jgi:hypothetical protein